LAAQQGVDTVTALCIEEVHEPLGVVLRVAANEGVQTVVRKALKRICDCLMSCAKKGQ
jgi:predicted dinucleotide-utilizing enzyme